MKTNKKIIFILIVLCLVLSGGYLVSAKTANNYEEEEIEFLNNYCHIDKNTSAASLYNKFSSQYIIEYDEENEEGWDFDKASCYLNADGVNITCTYTAKTNGMYYLAYDFYGDSDNVISRGVVDGSRNMTLTLTGPPGSSFEVYSYPKSNNVKACNTSHVSYNEDAVAREHYIYTASTALPATKNNDLYNTNTCKSIRGAYTGNSYARREFEECFNKDLLVDITKTESVLNRDLNSKRSILDNLNLARENDTGSLSKSNLYCKFVDPNNSNGINHETSGANKTIKSYTKTIPITDNNGKEWFDLSCTEDLDIKYDQPKSVYPGGGFKYTVGVKTHKTCKVIVKDVPTRPKVARPIIQFTDHYTPLGGPSEEFDYCVESCDGGVYSDKCSTDCYNKVYNGNSIKGMSFLRDTNTVSNMANTTHYPTYGNGGNTGMFTPSYNKNNSPWCSVESKAYKVAGRAYASSRYTGYFHWVVCPSVDTYKAGQKKPISVSVSATNQKLIPANKKGNVYGCKYGWQSQTCKGKAVCKYKAAGAVPGTVETSAMADAAYNKEKALFDEAKDKLKEYNCTFNGDYNNPKVTCGDNNTATTDKAVEKAKIKRTVVNGGKTEEFDISSQRDKKDGYYYFNFNNAYISYADGSVKYGNADTKDYKAAGKLFFTDTNITSAETNDMRYFPYNAGKFEKLEGNLLEYNKELKGKTYTKNNIDLNWNVLTQIKKMGSYQQWDIDVNCFYGTADYENRQIANLPYKYRTVNFEDLFPNRSPGYNWTNNIANQKASYDSYKIDPESLRDDIKSLGENIYKNEPYVNLSIGNNSQFNWSNIQSGDLYTDFKGNYTKVDNVSFFTSQFVGNHINKNRTK